MAVMDEFREEREALKHGTPKQKLSYFWLYYKWPVLITIFVIAAVISLVHSFVTKKDIAFRAIFLNSLPTQQDADPLLEGFLSTAGIDTAQYDASIESSMFIDFSSSDSSTVMNTQRLMVLVAAREVDVIAGDEATYTHYAYQENYMDLNKLLTPEELKALEPYLYYIDYQLIEQMAEEVDYASIEYPDPRKPEEMAQPIPVGIYVNDCEKLFDSYAFVEGDILLGAVTNTPRPEAAAEFIRYVLD